MSITASSSSSNEPFRIVVGAEVGTSTEQLKADINSILGELSSSKVFNIKVGIDPASKQSLQRQLDSITSGLQLKIKGFNISGLKPSRETINETVNAQKNPESHPKIEKDKVTSAYRDILPTKRAKLFKDIDPNLQGYKELEKQYSDLQERFKEISNETLPKSGDPQDRFQKYSKECQEFISNVDKLKTSLEELREKSFAGYDSIKEKGYITLGKLTDRVNTYENQLKNTLRYHPDLQEKINDLRTKIQATDPHDKKGIRALEQEFYAIKKGAHEAGQDVENFWQKANRVLGIRAGQMAITVGFQLASQAIKAMVSDVINLDNEMTQLKIITNDTDESYRRFANTAADMSQETGATITSLMNAAEVYARLGYSLNESLDLSKFTNIYSKVANVDIKDAEDDVTSITQAFNISTDKVESMLDKMTLVGNRFPISGAQLGEGLRDAGSALKEGGNSLSESIGLLTAGNAQVQDISKAATAIRTMTARIRNSSTKLKDLGEDVDPSVNTTAKYRDKLKALSGVDILQKDQKTFKSTFQILKELSNVWSTLNELQKASITTMIAGTRQTNVFASLMKNMPMAQKAKNAADNSKGALKDAEGKYLDSIQGRLNRLSGTFQKFSQDFISSGFVKGIVDVGNALLKVLDVLQRIHLLLPAILISASALIQLKYGIVSKFLVDMLFTLAAIPNSVLATIVAVGALFAVLGKIAYDNSLAKARKDAESAHQAVSDVKSELEENKKKIEEIKSAETDGSPTLAQQEELQALKDKNAQLKEELNYKRALAKIADEKLSSKQARQWGRYQEDHGITNKTPQLYNRFAYNRFTDTDGNPQKEASAYASLYEDAQKKIKKARDKQAKATKQEDKDNYEKKITTYKKQAADYADLMQREIKKISKISKGAKYTAGSKLTDDQKQINAMLEYKNYIKDRATLAVNGKESVGTIIEGDLSLPQFKKGAKELRDFASSANNGSASLKKLYNTNPEVKKLLDYLKKIGVLKWSNLKGFISQLEKVKNTENGIEDATTSAKDQADGLITSLSTLSDAYKTIASAQDEFKKDGSLTADTLKDINDKFGETHPEVARTIQEYINGYATAKDVIASMQSAYNSDVAAYSRAQVAKAESSSRFLGGVNSGVRGHINSLASAYNVDLKNYATIEQAKLNFSVQILQQLASKWKQYAGLTKAGVTKQAETYGRLAEGAYRSGDKTASSGFLQIAQAGGQAIQQMDDFDSKVDSFVAGLVKTKTTKLATAGVGGSSGSTGGKSGKSGSGGSGKGNSSSDSNKETAELLIKLLKHRYEMEQITAEQYYDGLEHIENKYYKNSAAHRKKYQEEILTLDEEIFKGRREILEDWLNDEEKYVARYQSGNDFAKAENAIKKCIGRVQSMMVAARKKGLNSNSDYMQELEDKLNTYQDDLLSNTKSKYETFISYMDDFNLWDRSGINPKEAVQALQKLGLIDLGNLDIDDFVKDLGKAGQETDKLTAKIKNGLSKIDVLKLELSAIDAQYQKGLLSWQKYVDAHNEVAKNIYSTQKDAMEKVIDETMNMLKQEEEDKETLISKQVESYDKLIDKRKELLDLDKEEEDHQEKLRDYAKEIAKLQSKISQLSLDNSREAKAKKTELQEQLADKQKELTDYERDYAKDQTDKALDKEKENFDEAKDAETKKAKESVDSWSQLYAKAIDLIDHHWGELYPKLMNYEDKYRSSIDGPSSLKTAWQTAEDALQQYGNTAEQVLSKVGTGASGGINPNTEDNAQGQAILSKMASNSAQAKLHPSQVKALHQENINLAKQYEELTGRKIIQDPSTGIWKLDTSSGSQAYVTQGSAAQKNPYSEPSGKWPVTPSSTKDTIKWLQYQLAHVPGYTQSITGQFGPQTMANVKRFQKAIGQAQTGVADATVINKLKLYHSGGIVDGTGAINDTEVLAILKRGELVLNEGEKKNLRSIISSYGNLLNVFTGSNVASRLLSVGASQVSSVGGDTFAPKIEVNISHKGSLSDEDAKEYGQEVGDVALSVLVKEFNKRGIK
jgi:TP901 family phage tail tape measure protein